MKIGDQSFITKIITEADITQFADLTLDKNPVHLDDIYAQQTIFKERIAHGILTGSLIGAVLGTKIPGPGAILLSQSFKFKKPVFINDEITAIVKISNIEHKNNKVFFYCDSQCENQKGEIVLEGNSVLLL